MQVAGLPRDGGLLSAAHLSLKSSVVRSPPWVKLELRSAQLSCPDLPPIATEIRTSEGPVRAQEQSQGSSARHA